MKAIKIPASQKLDFWEAGLDTLSFFLSTNNKSTNLVFITIQFS